MDKKYLLSVTCDNNDADYITESYEVEQQDLDKFVSIITKLLPYRSKQRTDKGILYSTGEMQREDSNGEYYIDKDILTDEETKFLEEYLPYGESHYSGIHTICNISAYEVLTKFDIFNN